MAVSQFHSLSEYAICKFFDCHKKVDHSQTAIIYLTPFLPPNMAVLKQKDRVSKSRYEPGKVSN